MFKLMNNGVMVSEPNYHNTKFFAEHLLAIAMRKTQILVSSLINI